MSLCRQRHVGLEQGQLVQLDMNEADFSSLILLYIQTAETFAQQDTPHATYQKELLPRVIVKE